MTEPLADFTIRVYREYGVGWILSEIKRCEDTIAESQRRLTRLRAALSLAVPSEENNG